MASKPFVIMRSLFVKIFLWFWLAMTVVSVASLILAVTTESPPLVGTGWFRFFARGEPRTGASLDPRTLLARRLRLMEGPLKLSAQTGVEVFERFGAEAYSEYIERLERAMNGRIFLFDARRKEVTGRPTSPEVEEMAAMAEVEGDHTVRWFQGHLLSAYRMSGKDDAPYFAVGKIRVPRKLFSVEPYEIAVNAITILLIAGVVCYWLARYITKPVGRLQAATRRIADGDLKVRVGDSVRRRRDEIADLGRDFDLMAERIESLVTSQHRLLRDISHELRSPLARLAIALELEREQAGPGGHGFLDRIERESTRLNDLIEQLLVISRLDSGVEKTASERVNIAELVEEVASDAEFEARGRGCAVEISVGGEPLAILGSRHLLRSAVDNIVRNAVRYTGEGTKVEITVASSLESGAPGVVITVRDHGPGVPEPVLKDMFRPFYRVGDDRDRAKGGAGLGLAIAERAIHQHGGRVKAVNAAGGGLLVTINLPAAPAFSI